MQTETVHGDFGTFEIAASDAGIRLNLKQFGAHQGSDLRMMLDCIGTGATVLDIGAHIGSFTVALARQAGPAGRVVAVEGNPDTYELLRRNLEHNAAGNVLALNRVVSDEDATYCVAHPEHRDYNTGATRFAVKEANTGGGVGAISLESLMLEHARRPVDFIKIDVESMDYEVIRSGRDVLRAQRPIVVFEFSQSPAAALRFSELFDPASYGFFVNLERGAVTKTRFEPFRLDGLGTCARGQHDVFAVPLEHPVHARWTEYRDDPEEHAYRAAKYGMSHGKQRQALEYLRRRPAMRHPGQAIFAGVAFRVAGSFDEAAEALERGVSAFPRDAELCKLFSVVRAKQERLAEATELARRAVVLAPSVADFTCHLAALLLRQEHREEAYALLHDYRDVYGPHPKALVGMSRALWRLDRRDAAIAAAEQALAMKPTKASWQAMLAGYLRRRRRFDDAVARMSMAVALRPAVAQYRADLARLIAQARAAERRRARLAATGGGVVASGAD